MQHSSDQTSKVMGGAANKIGLICGELSTQKKETILNLIVNTKD